jgi:putative ABC transport system permease protein
MRFLRRLASLARPDRADKELDREIASHLALLEDEFQRRGQSPEQARRSARLAMGGVEQTKERHRDARTWRWLDDLRRDTLYAVRILRRQPATAVAAILSLAVGIGLNAAVFSVVDWVLLRPLPYPAPHALVRVFTAGTAPATAPAALTFSEFERVRRAEAIQAAAGFTTTTRIVTATGIEPAHVVVARIAGDLFAALGVHPDVGRGFSQAELTSGAPVVTLAHDVWQRRFGGDRAIIGRTLAIDGAPHTIVGVMPAARGYPANVDLWRPLTANEREDDDRELQVIGRLRAGMTVVRASVEIGTIVRAATNGARDAWADEMQRTDAGQVRAALQALFAASVLTLLIACANVGALLAARVADRAGEMAVRGALGATRARILAQVVIESLVLAAAGGAIGLLLGTWSLTALIALAPVSIPRLAQISLDARIVGLGVAATVFTGLGVAIVPAVRLSRLTDASGFGRVGDRSTPRRSGRRMLVLGQVALAVVLVTGAGLLTRSLLHLIAIDHGFVADRLVAVDLNLRNTVNGDVRQLFRSLVAASETLPGVQSAAIAMRLPTQVPGVRTRIRVAGERELATPATLRPVSTTYFDTVGLPVTVGRAFTNADSQSAPRVAIVNTTFVRDLLGGGPALDVSVTTTIAKGPVRIVGVVGDVTPAGEPDRPALYVPVEQQAIGDGYLIVRAGVFEPYARLSVPALTERLRAVAPNLALDRVHRVADALENSRAMTRFNAQVSSAFAVLALLLAMIGVYGLTAGDVSARWRELAVRLALGASRSDVVWTVMRPCATVLAMGTALGLVGAVSVGPALASLLHGVRPDDVATLTIAPVLLGALGLVAALVAAFRVLRADPVSTLRQD